MVKIDEINRTLKDHEKRLIALESNFNKESSNSSKGKKGTLQGHILSLRGKSFFSMSKTPGEVHKRLQGSYSCEPNRVAMALLRLANKKQLRKVFKKAGSKRHKAYVW